MKFPEDSIYCARSMSLSQFTLFLFCLTLYSPYNSKLFSFIFTNLGSHPYIFSHFMVKIKLKIAMSPLASSSVFFCLFVGWLVLVVGLLFFFSFLASWLAWLWVLSFLRRERREMAEQHRNHCPQNLLDYLCLYEEISGCLRAVLTFRA